MLYSYRQYDRKYRLIVTSKSAGVAFDVSDLRCAFKIEKLVKSTANNAEIVIYNVSQESASAIAAGDTVVLEAGYKNGNYGMIFKGQVIQSFLERDDDVDVSLVLMCMDSDVFLTSKVVMATLGAGASGRDIVEACMDDSVTMGEIDKSIEKTSLPRGKVLFGQPKEIIEKVAKTNLAQFFVENGVVNVVAAENYASDVAVYLTPDTGLIGTPTQTNDGVKAKCLLNASLKLNGLVHIDVKYVNAQAVTKGNAKKVKEMNQYGVYKVIKMTYEGDSRGDSWYCDFEAIAMTGKRVAGLIGDATNIWG